MRCCCQTDESSLVCAPSPPISQHPFTAAPSELQVIRLLHSVTCEAGLCQQLAEELAERHRVMMMPRREQGPRKGSCEGSYMRRNGLRYNMIALRNASHSGLSLGRTTVMSKGYR